MLNVGTAGGGGGGGGGGPFDVRLHHATNINTIGLCEIMFTIMINCVM